MKCPNCSETDHEPSATYCHVCGTTLRVNSTGINQAEQPKDSEEHFFPIRRNSRIGFINVKGETVIEPRFLRARNFSEGLAAVQFENLAWGFIDKSGTILPTLTLFHEAKDFSEGLAAVKISGEFGYIDKSGKYVAYPQYYNAESFSEGLACVYVLRAGYGYIDKEGNRVIEPKYAQARSFHSGLAAVCKDDIKHRWGFIDKSDKLVIKYLFYNVGDFYENNAWAKVFEDGGYRVIGKNGIVKLNHHMTGLEKMVDFHEGLGRYNGGYVDWKKLVIRPRFTVAHDFSEGLACVSEDYYQFGYIDKSGKYVIQPHYTAGGDFSEGLAPVRVGQYHWGYIDRNDHIIIAPQFVRASSFSNGLAIVSTDQSERVLSYINKSGDIVSSEAIIV